MGWINQMYSICQLKTHMPWGKENFKERKNQINFENFALYPNLQGIVGIILSIIK
jgi:hypothetical protein